MLAIGTTFKAGKNVGRGGVQAVKNVKLPTIELKPLGKKGATFRGGRRVSPKSKTELRRSSAGLERSQQKGVRFSQQKGESILKFRGKDVTHSGLKEIRIRSQSDRIVATQADISTGLPGRTTSILTRKGSRVVDLIAKRTFKPAPLKPLKVLKVKPLSKPVYAREFKSNIAQPGKIPTGRISAEQTSVLLTKGKPGSQQLQKLAGQKFKPRVLPGDPARSPFAAQNIRDQVLTDVSVPPQQSFSGFRGGFRPGTRERLVAKVGIQKEALEVKRFIGQFQPTLNLPSGNIPRPVVLEQPVITKTSTLLLFTPSMLEDTVSGLEVTDLSVVKQDSIVSQDLFRAVKPAIATDTALSLSTEQELATSTVQDLITSPVVDTGRGISGESIGRIVPHPPPPPPPPLPPQPIRPLVPRTLPPPITPPPSRPLPPLPLLLPDIDARQRTPLTAEGFRVIVGREGGKIRSFFTAKDLTSASSRAREKLINTAAASFRITTERGERLSASQIGRVKGLLGYDFKISSTVDDGFIQKRGKRIGSPGEVRDISLLGGRRGKSIIGRKDNFRSALSLVSRGTSLREARKRLL